MTLLIKKIVVKLYTMRSVSTKLCAAMQLWFILESLFLSQWVLERVWNLLTISPSLRQNWARPLLLVFTRLLAFFHFFFSFVCLATVYQSPPSHATVLLWGSSLLPRRNSFHTRWLPRNVNEAAASGRFPPPVSHSADCDTAIMSCAHLARTNLGM